MATPNVPIECGICLEEYNSTSRRPRALPCSHNFCGQCLQKSIAQGANICSICRKVHTATSINDIPINSDLEKFIQMWSMMSLSNNNKANKTNDDGEEFCHGYCPRHRKSLLYFKCRTHGIDICRECTVIHHPPSKCDVIELKDEAIHKIEDTNDKALKAISLLKLETRFYDIILSDTKESILSKKNSVEILLKEIEEESEICHKAQHYISENNNFVYQLEECMGKVDESSSEKSIYENCIEIQNKIEIVEKCSYRIETLFSKLIVKDPESAMKLMKERRLNVFAVDGESRGASSKVLSKNGNLQFSSLAKKRPPADSIIIPVSSLLAVVSLQPIVYLDLVWCKPGNRRIEKPLGKVRIRLACSPKRQEHVLNIFTGMKGQSMKGSYFKAWNVGLDGEGLGCYGLSDEISSFQDQEEQECERNIEGNVTGFVDDANFIICTRTTPVASVLYKHIHSNVIGSSSSWTAPKIGHVLSGLDRLRNALRQYATHEIGPFYKAEEIIICDSGVEIPTNQQRELNEPQHCESDEDTTWAKDNRKIRKYPYISKPYTEKIQHFRSFNDIV